VTREASLGTISPTIFLDLLGFGLVLPHLLGVARAGLGACATRWSGTSRPRGLVPRAAQW
jgi:hypothetical protein